MGRGDSVGGAPVMELAAAFQVPSQAVSSVLVPPRLHRQGQREDRPYATG
jgi:hypothetical protein